MRHLWLARVLRDAGLPVHEEPGWQTRGAEANAPKVLVWHHTAGPATGDYPSLRVVRDGRKNPDGTTLPGPLSQLGLGRSGLWRVIASGKANHYGAGSTWNGVTASAETLGVEAENVGTPAEPWGRVVLDSYVRGSAAILAHLKLSAAAVCGHKECARPLGRKVDPHTLDMNVMRRRVQALLDNPEDEMAYKIVLSGPHAYITDGLTAHHIGGATLAEWRRRGTPEVTEDPAFFYDSYEIMAGGGTPDPRG